MEVQTITKPQGSVRLATTVFAPKAAQVNPKFIGTASVLGTSKTQEHPNPHATIQKAVEGHLKQLRVTSISTASKVHEYITTHGPSHAQVAVEQANRIGDAAISSAIQAKQTYDTLTPAQKDAIKIGVGVAASLILSPVVAQAAANMVGFGRKGIVAGSLAANSQPAEVEKDSAFAKAQSVGATGELGFPARVVVAAAIGGAIGGAVCLASKAVDSNEGKEHTAPPKTNLISDADLLASKRLKSKL